MENNTPEIENIYPESPLPQPLEKGESNKEASERVLKVRDEFFHALQGMGLSLDDATGIQHYLENQFEGATEDVMEKYLRALEDFRKKIKDEGFTELKKDDEIDIVENDAVMITRGGSIVIIKRSHSGHDVHYIPISPYRKNGKVIKEAFGKGYVKNVLVVGQGAKFGISNLPALTSPIIFTATGNLQGPEAMRKMEESVNQSFAGFRIPKTKRYPKD